MKTPDYKPDPRFVEAVQGLGQQARRDVELAREARPDLARSARAFFAPALRAAVTVLLIAVVVIGEAQRQRARG